jgi:hypothetical protein
MPLTAWQKKVPDKVKEALQSAMVEASEEPPADARLDQILERLERVEKRLEFIARQKFSSYRK